MFVCVCVQSCAHISGVEVRLSFSPVYIMCVSLIYRLTKKGASIRRQAYSFSAGEQGLAAGSASPAGLVGDLHIAELQYGGK